MFSLAKESDETDPLGNWGPIPSGGGTLKGRYCEVADPTSTVSGNQRILTLPISAKQNLHGVHAVTSYVFDHQGNWQGWSNQSSVTVSPHWPLLTSQAQPTSAVVGAPVTFTVPFSDSFANSDIVLAQFSVSTNLTVPACHVIYEFGVFYLVRAPGDVDGPVAPGNGTLTSTQCTVTNPSLPAGGNTGTQRTLSLPVTFTAGMIGAKSLNAFAQDAEQQTTPGWPPVGSGSIVITAAPPQQYSLTTAVSPSSGGAISPASGLYNAGAVVTVSATANSGYQFTGFSGDLSGTTIPQNLTMDGAKNVTANFAPTSYTAATIADLNNCLQNPQYTTCALEPKTYQMTSKIAIGRSNVTVTGASGNRSQTVLVRTPAFTDPMLQVSGTTPLSGVKIQNLTFCGSTMISNPSPNPACPPPVPTTCGGWTDLATQGLPLPEHAGICADLEIASVDTGTNVSNPFANSGPYSLEIANVAFEDAAGHAVILFPTEWYGQRVRDVYMHGNVVNNSAVTGILFGANTPTNYGNRKSCDTHPNFANDTNVLLPRNIRIEGNSFTNNNTGTIAGVMRWLAVRNNSFTNNFKNPQVKGNETGGTIFVDQCGDTVEISGNTTFTGPALSDSSIGASGLELWGRNITVQGNNISGYPSEGIGINSAYNVTLTNNLVQNNSTRTDAPLGGITAQTSGPGSPCGPIPRDVQTVSLSANTSTGQSYGVQLGDRGPGSRNTINGLIISGNNVLLGTGDGNIWQHPEVTMNGYSDSGLGTTVGPVESTTPRALAVDAVSPGTVKCSDSGSRRQTFKFSAGEVTGASDVQSIQGIFSICGDDASGEGGPVCPAQPARPYCSFHYDRASNLVFLDSQDGGYTWSGGNSIVGTGGSVLSNGYCNIHAASSSVQTESKVLSVSLDVEFLSSTYLSSRKHIYAFVQNTTGQPSNGGNWLYWGWWATP